MKCAALNRRSLPCGARRPPTSGWLRMQLTTHHLCERLPIRHTKKIHILQCISPPPQAVSQSLQCRESSRKRGVADTGSDLTERSRARVSSPADVCHVTGSRDNTVSSSWARVGRVSLTLLQSQDALADGLIETQGRRNPRSAIALYDTAT